MSNQYEDLVAQAFNNLGGEVPERKPKKQEPTKPDFEGEVSTLEGDSSFKAVFGIDAPSGMEHVGEVYKDSDWPEYLQAFIPDKAKFANYMPSPQKLEEYWVAYNMGDKTFATGPTGSGKSSFFEYWCAMVRQPFLRFNCREDMESSSIFGQMTAKDGSTHWEDGLLTQGFRDGAMLLLDEVSLMPAGISMGLQWVLEDGGKLMLTDKPGTPAEKLVEPDVRGRICMADNTRGYGDDSGAYAGTNVMNTATLNRINTFMHFDYLDRNAEIEILLAAYDDLTPQLAKKIVMFAELVRKNYDQDELDHTFSPRDLLGLTKKALYFKSFGKAVKMSWLEKFSGMEQQEAIKGHYKTVFNEDM